MKEKVEMIHIWRALHSPKKWTKHSEWYIKTHPEKFKNPIFDSYK